MIVVDTSVWIDHQRDAATAEVRTLRALVRGRHEVGLTDIVLTELLQGARTERDARVLDRAWLSSRCSRWKVSTTSAALPLCTARRAEPGTRSGARSIA